MSNVSNDGFTEVKSKYPKKNTATKTGTKAPVKDRNTKARPDGKQTVGGNRPPKRQFDRSVSGNGRQRGEKRGGNTKFGSGAMDPKADQVPADVVEEEVPVVEEEKVVKPEEPKAFVMEDFLKTKALVADDLKVARVADNLAEGKNISSKSPTVERQIIVTKPQDVKINKKGGKVNISEFLAAGPVAASKKPAAPVNTNNKKPVNNKNNKKNNDFPAL